MSSVCQFCYKIEHCITLYFYLLTCILLVSGSNNGNHSSKINFVNNEPVFEVDKSLFIREVIEQENNPLLITAPNGFGKTTSLNLLQTFLEIEVDTKGIRKSKIDSKAQITDTPNYHTFVNKSYDVTRSSIMNHLGKYPVIKVSFECFSVVASVRDAVRLYRRVVHMAYRDHEYLARSDRLPANDRQLVCAWSSEHNYYALSKQQVTRGLSRLAQMLRRHWDARSWVLVDDYDHVLQAAMLEAEDDDVFRRVAKLTSSLLRQVFSNNSVSVMGGVVAGELPVAVLDNLETCGFLENHRLTTVYGLTPGEVQRMVAHSVNNTGNSVGVEQRCGYLSERGEKMCSSQAVNQLLKAEEPSCVGVVKSELSSIMKIPLFREIIETLVDGEVVDFHKVKVFHEKDLLDLRRVLLNPMSEITPGVYNLLISYLFHKGILTFCTPAYQVNNPLNITYAQIPNMQVKEEIKAILQTNVS